MATQTLEELQAQAKELGIPLKGDEKASDLKKSIKDATEVKELVGKAKELGIELTGDETAADITKLVKAVEGANKKNAGKLGNNGKGSVARVILNDGNSKRVMEFTEREYGDGYVQAAREHFAAMKASKHTKGVLTIEE